MTRKDDIDMYVSGVLFNYRSKYRIPLPHLLLHISELFEEL